MFYNAKASVIIFLLLIVLLFAISECKRGGGGRIFRTTVLKSRRNSRKSRDLYAQHMMTSQWSDHLSVPNRPPDETLQTTYYNRGKIPLIYLPYDFIEHKKEYQSACDESVLQKKYLNRDDKLKPRSRESKNPDKDDVSNEPSVKRGYSLQGYPFGIITNNNENKQHITNRLVSKYVQTLNMDKIETNHYRININENNFSTNRLNHDVSPLLNVLIGKNVYKDRKIRSFDNFSTKKYSEVGLSSHNNSSYYAYNYYNYPKGTPKTITMSATRILFCQSDFSNLCTPYTFPLCTSYGTIMCVALEQQLVPCVEGSFLNCFVTIAVIDPEEIQDQGSNEKKKTDTLVKLPCVTKVTITVEKSRNEETFKRVKKNDMEEETTFCVVTVLIPKAKEEPDK